jgi:hypothetical protein
VDLLAAAVVVVVMETAQPTADLVVEAEDF